MSLYLKMLEGKLPPHWQRDWLENELLPSLDNNILCGNSLINSIDFDNWVIDTQGGLFRPDDDIIFRMNRFDWDSHNHGFGSLLDSQAEQQRGRKGFDCIIGNPPYIRVQEMNKWASDECEFYKWRYKSAAKGNYDIYVVFVERCLELLAHDGLLGLIMPHKFWQAKYGEGLRKLITDGKYLQSVIDFGDQQVFQGATTYTSIHVFAASPIEAPIEYSKVIDLSDGETQCRSMETGQLATGVLSFHAERAMPTTGWAFIDADGSKVLNAMKSQGPPLLEYAAKVFVGLQTSADKVFILERRDSRFYSEEIQTEVDLEPTYLHPLLKGSVHMKRWTPILSEQVVIFPYAKDGVNFRLVQEKKMRMETPGTWNYMERCRSALSKRERGTYEGSEWYGYVYPKNLASMSLPKILTPSLAQRGEYCLDKTGDYFFVGSGGGGGYGILLHKAKMYEYVLGLLNSTLLNWFVQKITTPFHSGWFAYNKQFIEQVPIKIPETADEKKLAERIVESVRAIMEAKTKLRDAKLSDRERRTLEGDVENHERRINELVFRLYGVEGLPT
jgi:hypothetical protein